MKDLEKRESAFFGKITAGITHEFKNVLAIIRESTGLMEDILSMMEERDLPHIEKFQSRLASIQAQVNRGVELASRLNAFAHSPDHPTARVDLNEVAEQLAFLSQRFARLKNVDLSVTGADRPMPVLTQPLLLLMALFAGVECCLGVLSDGGRIELRPMEEDGKKGLEIHLDGELREGEDFGQRVLGSSEWADVRRAVDAIGGTAQADSAARGIRIFLPSNS